MAKRKHLGWCVTVGKGNCAYIAGNKVFDKKRDAIAYRKTMGDVPWWKDWHITKIYGDT